MHRYRFDPTQGRLVTAHGSRGVRAGPVQHTPARLVVTALAFGPEGELGAHEAPVDQLFLVLTGRGWVAGPDGRREACAEGEAAFWNAGERHAAGTASGMTALVLEGEGLRPGVHLDTAGDG